MQPLAKQSLVDLVIAEVRRSILAGTLPPGSAVSISELSSQLDVSHIPVREALRRLEGEGLIDLGRGRGAVVAPLPAEDLAEVFRLRALIEADVLSRAVRLYTKDAVAQIEAAYRALRVRADDDAGSLAERHIAFHRLAVRPALTEWSGRLLDAMWQAGERYRYLIPRQGRRASPNELRDAHADILAAVRLGSAVAARRAVREHLARGVDVIGPSLPKPES